VAKRPLGDTVCQIESRLIHLSEHRTKNFHYETKLGVFNLPEHLGAVDDQELGSAQAAPNEIVEDNASGLDALPTHAL
jgi:hypothetical protein